MIIELNFFENKQNSENFDSETSKFRPVHLSETSGDTAGVHQRAATNELFYSRCLDFHENDKIIILKLALSE